MALGIAAGTLLRRTLPAMAVTLGGFVAVRVIIVLWVRAHYLSAVTVTYNTLGSYTPRGSYLAARVGRHRPGRPAAPAAEQHGPFQQHPADLPPRILLERCSARVPVTRRRACARALSRFRGFITYQPANRFWTFQGIETGIFVLLAAALIAVTAIVLPAATPRRRALGRGGYRNDGWSPSAQYSYRPYPVCPS